MNLKIKVKKYWNNQPCNIKHSNKPFASKLYFNEVRKKRYYVEKHIPGFAQFKKYKNKNVLEIGCGIGTDAVEFIKNGANYYGIEFSEASLNIAKERCKILKLNHKKINFILGDAESLSKIKYLKKIRFDLIYSFGVLHHTPNMKKCFDEIYKIANKNTVIKIMLYAKYSYKNFLVNHTIYRYERQKNCPVVFKVSNSDLHNLIKKRFKILNVSQDFIFPYKIKPYLKGKYEMIEHFKVMPKKIFNILKKNIGEHLLITLKKN